MTQFSAEQQLEIIELAEKNGACKGNLVAAKKYYADGDFEGVERVFRGDHEWLKYKLNLDILLEGGGELRYESGQMRYRETYKNGKLQGVREVWQSNGQMWLRETYKDGKLHGVRETRHANGQMEFRATYKDGKLEGILERWRENGQMIGRATYKDGVLISKETFK